MEKTALDIIRQKRDELDNFNYPGSEGNSKLDIARGTTLRVRRYCRYHGLDGIPDLNVIWKPPTKYGLMRMNPKKEEQK